MIALIDKKAAELKAAKTHETHTASAQTEKNVLPYDDEDLGESD